VRKISKVNRSVARNNSFQRGGVGIRERHNERKNECYSNPDIELDKSHLNVHFRKCDTTYEKALSGMIERGEVSTRGLKSDAKVFGELVFDVNTDYFEQKGGYDYAKQFFEEAYHFAEKEIGSPYILSAIMHADERNKGLSEQFGRDVYHYHLHVIYIPVVEKEVLWSKRCKDPELRGTVKKVINQISNSKKWEYPLVKNEQGVEKRVSSYSILQTRFFNHMKEAGFKDFERGIEGSTAENLSTTEYKNQQEQERLKETKYKVMENEMWLDDINDRIRKVQPVYEEIDSVDKVGKKKRFGNKIELTTEEFDKLTNLAKFGIKAQATIENLNDRVRELTNKYNTVKTAFDKLKEETKQFVEAVKEAPEKVVNFIADVINKARAARELAKEQEKLAIERRRAEMKARLESPWTLKIPPKPKPKERNRGYDRDSR